MGVEDSPLWKAVFLYTQGIAISMSGPRRVVEFDRPKALAKSSAVQSWRSFNYGVRICGLGGYQRGWIMCLGGSDQMIDH